MRLLRVSYYDGDNRYQRGWWAVVDNGDGKERPHFLWADRGEPDTENLSKLIEGLGTGAGIEVALTAARLGARVEG